MVTINGKQYNIEIPEFELYCDKCETTNYIYDDMTKPYKCDNCGELLSEPQQCQNNRLLLYHGSNVEVIYPNLAKSKKYMDFGIGFYLTTNKEQAIMFSRKVVLREIKKKLPAGNATVNVYEFDIDEARKSLTILKFDQPTGDWLDYVFNNRKKIDCDNIYDVVIGPIANDDVYAVIDEYENGEISRTEAIKKLKIKDLFNQYTLKTNKALKLLKFLSSFCSAEDVE